jgi:hypothetical protein
MKKHILIFILFIVSTAALFSQEIEVVQDLGLWFGGEVKKDVFEDFTVSVEQQLRMSHNMTEIDDYVADLNLDYDANKHIELSVGGRYILDNKIDDNNLHNLRYNGDIKFKTKIGANFKFDYRIRYQQEYEHLFTEDKKDNEYTSDWRNRVKLQYRKFEKHKFYVSTEIFKRNEISRGAYFHKLRIFVGDEIKIGSGNIDCAFGYERKYNKTVPTSFYFVKIIYKYSL